MKRIIPTTIFLLMLGLALPALADDPVPALESGVPDDQIGQAYAPLDTPLDQTIAEIRQDSRARANLLAGQLATVVSGSEEARELEQQISQLKLDTEIAIVQAIVTDARQAGDGPRQAEAEEALDRLLHPENYRTPATPVERSVPAGR